MNPNPMRKEYLLSPGPTPIPPDVAAAATIPIIHHRTPRFEGWMKEVSAGLQYLFCTKNDVITLSATGTGAMEAAVANLLSPGDTVICAIGGKFGDRWVELCRAYQAEPVIIQAPYGTAPKPEAVREALRNHPNAKAVFTQLCETSTGCRYDVKAIGEIVAETPAVFVVDGISGLLAEKCATDAWMVDVLVSGSQKGFMLPPGLAFISMSTKAWAAAETAKSPRYYFDLRAYKKGLATGAHPYTPAVGLITQLQVAIQQLRTITIEGLWARHAWLGNACRAGVKALNLEFFAETPANVLTAVKAPAGIPGEKIVGMLRDRFGVTIAGAQGAEMKGKIFRIAHLGYMDRFDMVVAMSALELTLQQLGYPVTLGTGVAATEALLVEEAKV